MDGDQTRTVEQFQNGSSILFPGGYVLTAKHIGDPKIEDLKNPWTGQVVYKYDHREMFLTKEGFVAITNITDKGSVALKDKIEGYKLEMIVSGDYETHPRLKQVIMDYALLKVKDAESLQSYSKGLNFPEKIGSPEDEKEAFHIPSIIVGYPKGFNRNWRYGHVSQEKSDAGDKDHITFKNSMCRGDSGGPVYIVEKNGDLKLAAIAKMIIPNNQRIGYNINYGLKIESIVKDLESKLESGKLDEKTTKEIKRFLELNKVY